MALPRIEPWLSSQLAESIVIGIKSQLIFAEATKNLSGYNTTCFTPRSVKCKEFLKAVVKEPVILHEWTPGP